MTPRLTLLTEERGAWARDELARPGYGRHVCGADVFRAATTGSDRLWTFEEAEEGAWSYWRDTKRMHRISDTAMPRYRLHRCDQEPAVEPAA